MHVCVLSLVQHFGLQGLLPHQAPLSMGSLRQEYWHGLPFPPPGDLSNSVIKLKSPASPALAGRSFTTEAPGKPG